MPEGGWIVPQNAVAAAPASTGTKPEIPIPSAAAPGQGESWHVPPEASERVAALTRTDGDSTAPTAGALVSANAQKDSPSETKSAEPASSVAPTQPKAAKAPEGAALSTEVDYSNYVPGVGFVGKTEAGTTSTAPQAAPAPIDTPAQPVVMAPQQPAQTGTQPAQSASPTAPQAAQPVQPAQTAPAVQAAATGPSLAATGTQDAAPAPETDLAQRFTIVERSVQVLRRKYTAGSISRDQLQAELRKLMILDEDGQWWMIGLESDRWYKYSGKDWTPATPPGRKSSGGTGLLPPLDESAPSRTGTSGFKIPLDEYGMPLPQRVPLEDPGATVVGRAAARLDNTLRAPSVSSGATVPSASAGLGTRLERRLRQERGAVVAGQTVPGAAVRAPRTGIAVPGAPGAPAQPDLMPDGRPRIRAGMQPDYGEKPRSAAFDPARRGGCLIRLAIVSVFLVLGGSILAMLGAVLFWGSTIGRYETQIANLGQAAQSLSQSVRIFDASGRVIYQLNDPNVGARRIVPLSEISKYLIFATVATENERFYSDPGFDIVAIARAILQNLRAGEGVSGASTLTQQITRLLVFDPTKSAERTTGRKIEEIIISSEIARRYSKSQILEFYLNSVYYGNLAYGAEAASQTYFRKPAKDLSLAEASLLAGLVQAPATYDPALKVPLGQDHPANVRARDVRRLMVELGCIQMEHDPYKAEPVCISQTEVDQAKAAVAQVEANVMLYSPPENRATYPHFVQYVRQQLEQQFDRDTLYKSALNVYTTIDPRIQDIAENAVKDQIANIRRLNATSAAVIAIRPSDGAIVAMVGSADFYNKDIDGQFNVVTQGRRQPGSSIKPFIYLTALEPDANKNAWTPATVLWDVPTCFANAPANYCPKNYDDKFNGPLPVRLALGQSRNIPAVKTLQYIGIDRFKQMAQRVGLNFPLTQPDQAGLQLALGGIEVTPMDMARGYAVLANYGRKTNVIALNGQVDDHYAVAKITRTTGNGEEVLYEAKLRDPSQVVEPALTFLISSILSDDAARSGTFGRNSILQLRNGHNAAVKTGTTNDSKDNWTIGYTPQLVVAVWVGNANNTPMRGTSGITGAAPIWSQVMQGALAGQQPAPFAAPGNIQQANVCSDFGTQDFAKCLPQSRRAEFFFAPVPPPSGDAVLTVRQIDTFSGLIANGNCPDFVQERSFLAINDPTAINWLNTNPAGQKWAQERGVTLPVAAPPTGACEPNMPRPRLQIASPQVNSEVRGLVQVQGTVFVPGFNRYQIEVAPGTGATQFAIVDGPITAQPGADNVFLGRWDTSRFPNGPYLLKLWAVDGQGRFAEVVVPVLVNNVEGPPTQPDTSQPPTLPTQPGQPTQPTQAPPVFATQTPIVINPNPAVTPTPTFRSIFPTQKP